ncbi:replication endonuclease [Vibrio sp. SS-MA-C1-2]|uniref:replication endonuclease n=1 Tax=Vibrio sp. SS-MA-C1-2 TaxID=2908646 RepID=UPI001F3B03C1|nr:replication endonuclease [Vibrio sp. SS-MA-C1-2]UJF19126.1 replication endonuclease [Vibrio sp. SS-MA-C1-2]
MEGVISSVICLDSIDRDDQSFVFKYLKPFPFKIQSLLLNEYLSKHSKFERNSFLRVTVKNLTEKLSIPLRNLELNLHEDDLREKAKNIAKQCLKLREMYLIDSIAVDNIRLILKDHGISSVEDVYSLEGELARYCDPKWWLRRLRKSMRKNIEIVLHHLNQVNKKKSLYCSNITLQARIRQKQYQEQYLENTIATNQDGDSFTLLELSQKGVSDPTIRKGELMMRARGFEDLAKELGHEATFLTFTCPSKYHRSYAKSGDVNHKWGGYTPLDGQKYLNKQWQLIRATLNRLDIRFYGFRVVEPQHDGTPHWHLLLFVEKEHYEEMVSIMREYIMKEDREEKGAEQHRFTEVKIDPAKGSATGYIAKYISKNIDGSDLDTGIYGEDPTEAAARVDAWASCWGIRQFQQLGGCSVTVWRELRRLQSAIKLPEKAKKIFKSADTGNWKEYLQLMGGVFCGRKDQAIQPYYEWAYDADTGVIKSGQYSENELVKTLKGVSAFGKNIETRVNNWTLESKLKFAF